MDELAADDAGVLGWSSWQAGWEIIMLELWLRELEDRNRSSPAHSAAPPALGKLTERTTVTIMT